MSVSAKFEGIDEFEEFLRNAEAHYGSTKPLMRRIGRFLRSSTVKRIDEGNLDAENAEVTTRVKRNDNPLQDRGNFQQSIRSRATETAAMVGSNATQAAILQTGGTIEAQSAEQLAIPAGRFTRLMQRRFGFAPPDVISTLRENDWAVWFLENAIMAQKTPDSERHVLFIRKPQVEIPAYRPFQLTGQNQDDIRRIVAIWQNEVEPKGNR